MPSISATGLGSGLDIESIISGLMSVERRPLNALNQRQNELESKISAYGQMKSAVSAFQTALSGLKSIDAFQTFSATSSNEDAFTATATSSAVAGSYDIGFTDDGTNKLAQAHKLISDPQTDGATSIGATGALDLTINGTTINLTIDGTNDTLEGIRDAINNSADNNNLVTATIINVDSGSKLVLTSDNTGLANEVTIGAGAVATAIGLAEVTAAQDAKFTIDNNLVSSSSNSISDAIEGVTINLKAFSTSATTLDISYDDESVKESVQSFVDAYNTLNKSLSSLREGKLKGDNAILSIESRIRNIFNTKPNGLNTSLSYLSEIGITTGKTGDLSLSSADFAEVLSTNYDGVAELFGDDDQGYSFRLDALAEELLDTDGLIKSRTATLDSQVDRIGDDILNVEYRMGLIEQRYRKQFTSLDSLLAGLNSTSTFLTQQLASLPKPKSIS